MGNLINLRERKAINPMQTNGKLNTTLEKQMKPRQANEELNKTEKQMKPAQAKEQLNNT